VCASPDRHAPQRSRVLLRAAVARPCTPRASVPRVTRTRRKSAGGRDAQLRRSPFSWVDRGGRYVRGARPARLSCGSGLPPTICFSHVR
jgi:hypothetical protein